MARYASIAASSSGVGTCEPSIARNTVSITPRPAGTSITASASELAISAPSTAPKGTPCWSSIVSTQASSSQLSAEIAHCSAATDADGGVRVRPKKRQSRPWASRQATR